ncbi:MAG: alpha-E domain-containing protein [Saprospiraceae bacterium]|nr:alpha-E domain-containing protein [Saprospiraceae bacterium]
MLSRVAESVFWMARYMERSNSLLRLLRTYYIASQDDMQDLDWQLLLRTYSSNGQQLSNTFPNAILQHLIFDRENDASVISNIARARENARAVQDNMAKEVWQCLNDYYHLIRDPQLCKYLDSGDPVTMLDILIREAMLYYGTVDTMMARGEGFNFLNIGKFLERAAQTTYALQMKLFTGYEMTVPSEATSWRYVLYSLSGYQLYIKTHRGNIQPQLVAQHALLNADFPHSVFYCIKQINRYFQRLKSDSPEESFQKIDFIIGKTLNMVRYNEMNTFNQAQLSAFLYQIQIELANIASGLNEYYFGSNY